MHTVWQVQKTNSEYVDYLSCEASITPAMAQVFINRGIKTPEDVAGFLAQSLDSMSDPLAMSGIPDALDVLQQARQSGTRVMVHGDYDADGVTATTMVVSALRTLNIDVVYFIPSRFEHGYGFNPPAIDLAKKMGAKIILTVDCGVSALETAKLADEAGLTVIITDHHEPLVDDAGRFILPVAKAVINPKLCSPEIANLSGAGVAYKLLCALSDKYPGTFEPKDYLDLAALGTLADSVPLVGENRAIVKEGMPLIREGIRPGIAALRDVAGVNPAQLKAMRVLFTLVPRINAAGRVADATMVVDMLLADNATVAVSIAEQLNELNLQRQSIEEIVFREALVMAEAKGDASAIVLCGKGWHEGVLGIVASRMVDRFSRPALVMAEVDGQARGSARSMAGFDIYTGLGNCSDTLITFGGHRQAAGFSLNVDKLEEFERGICAEVDKAEGEQDSTLNIDAALNLRDVNFKFIEELEMLEPFGYGNPEPIFGCKDLEVVNSRIVGRNHLKMTLKASSLKVDSIGYNMGDFLDDMDDTFAIDAAFAAGINEWGGRRSIQLTLKAIRPSD